MIKTRHKALNRRSPRFATALIFCGLLTACESTSEPLDFATQNGRPVMLAAADNSGRVSYQVARSPYGHYLAARFADRQRDLSMAADFMLRALELDPDNLQILGRSFALVAGDGRMPEAFELARRLVAVRPEHGTARLMLAVEAVSRGGYEEADDLIAGMASDGLGRVIAAIAGSWIALGNGESDLALSRLDWLATLQGFEAVYRLQTALVQDVAGRQEAALAAYDQALTAAGRPWLRLVVLAGNAFERAGQTEKAASIYGEIINRSPDTTFFETVLADLKAGRVPPPVVPDVNAGLAESLFNLASFLGQERSEEMALIYTQAALHLKPDLEAAMVLKGEIHQDQGRGTSAIQAYEGIPKGSPFYWSVQLRIADELGRQGQIDTAIDKLEALARIRSNRYEPLFQIGNMLRSEERFEEAVDAYDRAVKRIGEPQQRHWSILYFRGIALERTDNWRRAEADFLKALEFEPEQPYVMNYLAYSWVEKKTNLERAKVMLARAVELRPDDGYIVDSLGWVHYRVGEYEKAVKHLERAVELRPVDPVINDHLGDAYWRVGREAEARFQWRRALSFDPEDDQISTIESKLERGLSGEDLSNI